MTSPEFSKASPLDIITAPLISPGADDKTTSPVLCDLLFPLVILKVPPLASPAPAIRSTSPPSPLALEPAFAVKSPPSPSLEFPTATVRIPASFEASPEAITNDPLLPKAAVADINNKDPVLSAALPPLKNEISPPFPIKPTPAEACTDEPEDIPDEPTDSKISPA
jgi:hypothetical protein